MAGIHPLLCAATLETSGKSMTLFALCIAIQVLAPIVCFVNYFERSRLLHRFAVVLAVLSVPATFAATYILYNFQSLLPAFCLVTVFAKIDNRVNAPLYISFLKYLFLLFTFLSAAQLAGDNVFAGSYPDTQIEQYTIVLYAGILFTSAFLFLRRLYMKALLYKVLSVHFLWGAALGLLAYSLHVTYLFSYAYLRGSNVLWANILPAILSARTASYLIVSFGASLAAYLFFIITHLSRLKKVKSQLQV